MAEAESGKRQRIDLNWKVGAHSVPEGVPDEFYPARVPGSVQLDWARAKGWGEDHYWFGENFEQYRWCEDSYWTYRAELPDLHLERGQSVHFRAKGIDYQCAIFAGDLLLHEQEGMYTPIDIDVTPFLGGQLRIRIDPAPKSHHDNDDRSQADHCCKPPASYGWDWHPRLVPLGIWQDAWLEVREPAVILDPSVQTLLAPDFSSAQCHIHFRHTAPGKRFAFLMESPDGQLVVHESGHLSSTGRSGFSVTVGSPQLWWPHDHGAQALYPWTLQILDENGNPCETVKGRVGFRQVRLVMNEGAWGVPANFPKDRSPVPIQVEINGRRIFAKGSNWVPPRIFYSELNREVYEPLLRLAKDAHFNMLRCWGGGVINKDSFFDLCDELGILIWQEFPLACNDYPDDPHYLRVLEQESREILRRLRNHPCLAMWCGGNELFNAWSGMTDQSLALRLLNKLCYEEDPQTPFIPTAPVTGMGHGTYKFLDHSSGLDCFELYRQSRFTAYSETGVGGPSSVDAIRRMLPEGTEWPPQDGGVWKAHHGKLAWTSNAHFNLDILEKYFGEMAGLEEAVERGQFMQAEGLRCIFEEGRRQKPFCSMVLNWDFNDVWPSIANCSIIQWPDTPKPAYTLIQQACRPILASARIPKFQWLTGDVFEAELWLLSDAHEVTPPGQIEAWIRIGDQEERLITWHHNEAAPNGNLVGPTVRWKIPESAEDAGEIHLILRVEGHADRNSAYRLPVRHPARKPRNPMRLNE